MAKIFKLKVGVVLNADLIPHGGGTFSYYSSIIKAIDDFNFNSSIEIVFINFEDRLITGYKKEILNINIRKIKKTNVQYIVGRFFHKLLLFLRVKHEDLNNMQTEKYILKVNATVEEKLKDAHIDLLYYLVQTLPQLDYPYIMTHWDNGQTSMFAFPEVAMNQTFERKDYYHRNILQKAFAIFSESEAGKCELQKYGLINPERIFIVPLFPGDLVKQVLEPVRIEEILKKFDLMPGKFFFYPAQFWSHKNHANLLLAFRKFLDKYPGIKLVFSGTDKGNLRYIQSIISELNLQENVLISGFVETEELFCFYKQAIALVMPTFLGPTNMPVLEAYELDCKVICSNLEGHKEFLGDEAVYFNPANVNDIFAGLELVMTEGVKESKYKGRFSAENSVKEIEKNLCSLLPIRKAFGYDYKQY